MTIQEVVEQFRQASNAYEAKKKQLATDLLGQLPELVRTLLAGSTRIFSYTFTAYTPYWCDGDTCTYSVNAEYGTLNQQGLTDEDGEDVLIPEGFEEVEEDPDWSRAENVEYTWHDAKAGVPRHRTEVRTPNPAYDAVNGPIYNALIKAIDSIPDEVMLEMFDDHKQITFVADGRILVDDYEHD